MDTIMSTGERKTRTKQGGCYETEDKNTSQNHTVQSACERPAQPMVTSPLTLLTLLVFHPHCLTGSIYTSITLQRFIFAVLYAKGAGSMGGVPDGKVNRCPDSSTCPRGADIDDQSALLDHLRL